MVHRPAPSLVLGLVLTAVLALAPAAPASAATFPVTTRADSGAGSLRQAITDANANPGADVIEFAVDGTIDVLTVLPSISGELLIRGTGRDVTLTGPGGPEASRFDGLRTTANVPLTVLDLGVRGFTNGVFADGNPVAIRGVTASDNTGFGIFAVSSTPEITDNVVVGPGGGGIGVLGADAGAFVAGNAVGEQADGTVGPGLTVGILAGPASFARVGLRSDGTVDGNVVVGASTGILFERGGAGLVVGNTIGGAGARRNDIGVRVLDDAPLQIGTATAPNTISGNGTGIDVLAGSVRLDGNRIGTTADGLAPLPNDTGVRVQGGTVRIGDGGGNTIAGNTGPGVQVTAGTAYLAGNRIGGAGDGSDLPNGGPGIQTATGPLPPAITDVQRDAAGITTITGTATAPAGLDVAVDVFRNGTCAGVMADEGAVPVVRVLARAGVDGAVSWSTTLPAGLDGAVTATLTALPAGGTPSTSAFSTCTPLNTAPAAQDDAYAVAEDGTLTIPAPGFLANDTDAEGDALTAVVLGTSGDHGTLSAQPDGSIQFTPGPDRLSPVGFTYQATDGSLTSDVRTATITITPVNDAPDVVDAAFAMDEDTVLDVAAPGVLAGAADVDGDALTARLVTGPASGTVVMRADGSFTYTPAPDFFGTDTFTFTASDGFVDAAPATVTITVADRPEPAPPPPAPPVLPVAVDDAYAAVAGEPLVVEAPGVAANDRGRDELRTALADAPAEGVVELAEDGSFTYTADESFAGTDAFTYTVVDATGRRSLPATVVIEVAEAPIPVVPVEAEDNVARAIAWSQLADPSPEGGFAQAEGRTVLLGRDDLFADSLASGGLQGALDAPLLLTGGAALDDRVVAELDRLDAARVVLLGGEAALAPAVADALADLGLAVERVGGPSRIETAVAAASLLADGQPVPQVVVARAHADPAAGDATQGFADALAAAALAADLQVPLLLTETAALSEPTAGWLATTGVEDVLVVGGEAAVGAAVLDDLAAMGIDVERLAGGGRAGTAVAVAAERGAPTAADADGSVLVDGQDADSWADAFPAARYASRALIPVVLSTGNDLPPETTDYLRAGGTPLTCASLTDPAACAAARALLGGAGG